MGEKSNRFCALVVARQKEKNLDYSTALLEISRENPGLAEEYRSEVTGRRVRHEMIGPHPVLRIIGAEKELLDLARARMVETGLDYRTCFVEVGREHPDLVKIARLQVLEEDFRKSTITRG
jgi:hypothetical protein